MNQAIHVVLLCGGSGTRLWPLSREERPKQFLKVLKGPNGHLISMAQRTLAKIASHLQHADVTIVTCESQQPTLENELSGNYFPVIEPEQRNTAPAIFLACASLKWVQGANDSDVVLVLPIDGHAEDSFYQALYKVITAATQDRDLMVLLGVQPSSPSQKYGYIVPRNSSDAIKDVLRFTEKPDVATAQQLIKEGALWNCGVFAFQLSYVVNLLSRYGDFDSFADVVNGYQALPKQSFDFEVVENAKKISVVPYDGQWADLGTWSSLMEVADPPTIGRVTIDADSCADTHIINETSLPVVVSGITNAVVVVTDQGVLVCSKESDSTISRLVESVRADQFQAAKGTYCQ